MSTCEGDGDGDDDGQWQSLTPGGGGRGPWRARGHRPTVLSVTHSHAAAHIDTLVGDYNNIHKYLLVKCFHIIIVIKMILGILYHVIEIIKEK